MASVGFADSIYSNASFALTDDDDDDGSRDMSKWVNGSNRDGMGW